MRNGGIIGPANTANATTASGVWRLEETQYAIANSTWPVATLPTRTVEYFVVGGGGSGGNNSAGGGGAGGLITGTNLTLNVGTSYTATVGAGGSGSATLWGYSGRKGTSSTFATLVAKGGGGGIVEIFGDANDGYPGRDVASGGGYISGPSYTYQVTQGFTGGTGYTGSYAKAGGGGGSAGAGANGTSSKGGNGGLGTTSTFTGTSMTYCGGGGGCGDSRNIGSGPGIASHGGSNGTNGVAYAGSAAARANSGAGSGGNGYFSAGNSTNSIPGNGGSGLVAIRYSNSLATATTQTGAVYYNTGGFHTYVFLTSGSITL
jgi:hypothetical protein